MKKKFLALVLTLAMVLSLVPVTALAVGENEVSTDANSPVQIKKSINDTGDKLTLEAYLTNEVTENVSTKPLDIVLVLDQSGSMAYNFEGNTTDENTERRQYAMKEAVKNFIGKAYSENGTHKMAIVTFSGDAAQLADWTTVDASGRTTLINSVEGLDDTPSGATNVAAGMQKAQTLLNAQTNSDSQKVVIVFTDGVPTTQSNFDTTVANSAITAAKAMKNAGAVVYTVGIFNGAKPEQLYGDKWNYAINKDIPCTGEEGSYWGGSWLANLFGNNDFDAIDVPAGNRFLNYLSSNFSEATGIGITKGRYNPGHMAFAAGNGWKIEANSRRTASTYYLTATNADGLNSVFEKIIEEISTLEIEAGTDAILSDTLSEYFDLNIPEGATAESAITVKQWNCTGKDNDGYAWMEASEQPTTINVQVTGKKIEVTGFDYTTNAVTKTTSGSGTVYSGSKLVVTIPIKPDTAYTNWEKGSNLYPTNNTNNDNQAGLSNYKNKNGETLPSTLLTESPKAKVTAYTVTYEWGNIENATSVTDNQYYISGQTAQVKGTVSAGTAVQGTDGQRYRFNGWSLDGVHVIEAVDITDSNVTLKPVLTKAYTVTYKIDGQVYGIPEEYTCGTEVTVKNIPTRTGYTFKGWTISDGAISNGKFEMPAQNVELTGSWTANNDVSYTVHYYKKGTTDKVAEDKEVTGKTFNTEVTETAETVSGYTVEGEPTRTITLDAYNKEITFYYTANTYTVTWMNGNDQLKQDKDVPYNAQPNYGGTAPTKAADSEYTYQFVGWSANPNATTGTEDNALLPVTSDVTYYAIFEATAQTYTVIFDAKGGNWSENETQKTRTYNGSSASVTRPGEPTKSGYLFVAWTYENADGSYEEIPNGAPLTVNQLMNLPKADTANRKVTLYAKWRLNPEDQITYTIRQHFMKDEKQELGAQNYIKLKEVQAGTEISTLIPSDTRVEFDGRTYLYEANNTTVNNQKYEGTEEITGKDTVIDLYYYLDSWKDGDVGPGDKTDDSLTGGDGTPDYKQILIQYQVYQKDNGLVTPEFEVVTVKNGNELTAIHGSSVTKAGTGYTFVTWTGRNVAVTETTVGEIIDKTSAEKLKNPKCDPSGDTFEQGKSYTYTAIFLEDKLGGGDNKDQPDGIPDAWQYKVTFKVVNGKWNNQTTADVVAYVTNKKNDTPCAKGTEGSKATLDGVTIPVAGSQPDSGYRASGNWDTTPSATTVINKEDTVFTYTYDQKSGGSGGSGGSHKPTVTIPDDVPTGLNGKDHYAYVVGYPDGMVYPQKNITRAEVATIFFRLLKDETREANMTKSNSYNDMKDGAWYTCAVSTLSKMGIIKGYEDGSFKPDASISRAEFAAIAARFDPDGDKTPATFSDVSSHWAKDEISIAANHGWIKGYEDGSFKPDQKITRAETMTLVNRVLKRLPETKDDLHKDMKTWPDNQNESAWFYLAVQEATNSHYQKLKKDGIHETWESMRETRDWAALEK